MDKIDKREKAISAVEKELRIQAFTRKAYIFRFAKGLYIVLKPDWFIDKYHFIDVIKDWGVDVQPITQYTKFPEYLLDLGVDVVKYGVILPITDKTSKEYIKRLLSGIGCFRNQDMPQY